ncbi:MAG: DUF1648 domain-containing protein [Proteobacteria bacterium]|nr:DUF1648 domain-containing protein [Pseudomonadota bacterium]MCP4918747.1 DUF1648 domain-containing protein [Pseudomonadota bacterium]
MRSLIARAGFAGLLAVYTLLVVYGYPQLPEMMASNFNGAGDPHAWQTKATFVGLFTAAGVGSFLLVGLSASLIRRTPAHLLSIPNKDYWMAPGRAEQTVATLSNRLLEFCNVSLVGLVHLFHHLCATNVAGNPHLPSGFGWGFAGYMIFTLVWTAWLILSYRRP